MILIFCAKLAKKGCLHFENKTEHQPWIQRIWISLCNKFLFKETIITFRSKFA